MGNLRKAAATYLSKLSEQAYGVPPQLANVANYFLDSYLAKLEERALRNRQPEQWYPADPHAHIRELWLGCELHTALTLNRAFPLWAKALYAYAFVNMFSGPQAQYRLVPFLDQYEFKDMLRGHYAYRVQSEQLEIAPGKKATMAIFGNFFVEHVGSGARLFITMDLGYESMACTYVVMAAPQSQGAAEQFFADFDASCKANDIYYKQCLQFVRGTLGFAEVRPTAWESIVIKPELKDKIQQNTVDVLANMEQFTKLGMCPNQNMILISPPGMAKTTIFRAISWQIDQQMTRIWCTGKSINSSADVTSLFDAARTLSPCLIFIEDMDLFGRDRTYIGGGDNHVLNEFLACLDGAQANAGVVVMASTNDIASMDEALVNRPGRFDMKVEILLPDVPERSAMLGKFLVEFHAKPDQSVTQDSWMTIIKMMDGLTGDYIKSLAKAVVIRAVHEGRGSGEVCMFTVDDLNFAAEQVLKNFSIGKRAKKHHFTEGEVTEKG